MMTTEAIQLREETAKTTRTRIDYYDIAKGIGIILVVWAHAKGPHFRYIYQFHMPFFFLISGLLYNGNVPLFKFITRKIKSLYIPFAFWNILFYTVKSVLSGVATRQIIHNDILIGLTLSKDGQFFGATWFLGSLFLISILYRLFEHLMGQARDKDLLLLILNCVLALVAIQITFPHMLSRTMICSLYFSLGAFVRKRDYFKSWDSFGAALACLCLFLVISHYGSVNMGKNEYRYPLQALIGAVLASYAVLYLCKEFDKRARILLPLKKVLVYLGKHSLDIVIWQFVFFRLVIILQMYLNHEAITLQNVLSYYPCYSVTNGWWIVYTLVGLFVPILFCELLRYGIWGKFFKKIHIV